MNLIKVFKNDGSLQCGYADGRTLKEMEKELAALGGDVKKTEQGYLPVVQVCGYPTGSVAICSITEESWKSISSGFVGPNGWAIWPYDSATASVYKYDGTLQCGEGAEITLDQMAGELRSVGIEVVSQRKGTDGLMHMTVCGGSTGSVNIFEIQETDVEKAKDIGFLRYVSREDIEKILPGIKISSDDYWPFPL